MEIIGIIVKYKFLSIGSKPANISISALSNYIKNTHNSISEKEIKTIRVYGFTGKSNAS